MTTADTAAAPRPAGSWSRTWFTPGTPAALLAVRVLVFVTVAADVFRHREHFATLPERGGRIWEPISALGTLRVPPPTPAVVAVLTWTALLGCCLALVRGRLLARTGGAVTLLAYGYLQLAENSFGKIDHDRQPLLIMLVVLTLADVPRRGDAPSWRWGWPVQACRAALAVMLLAAAWSKLTVSGVEWVFSANLRNVLAAESLLFRDPALSGLALWVASEPWRWQLVALGTLVGEAVMIGAIIVRRQPWRGLFAAAGVSTLVGITLFMGLVGFPLVVLAAVMLDVDGLGTARSQPRRAWRRGAVAAAGLAVLSATTWLAAERPSQLVPLAAFAVAVAWFTTAAAPKPARPDASTGQPTTGPSPSHVDNDAVSSA